MNIVELNRLDVGDMLSIGFKKGAIPTTGKIKDIAREHPKGVKYLTIEFTFPFSEEGHNSGVEIFEVRGNENEGFVLVSDNNRVFIDFIYLLCKFDKANIHEHFFDKTFDVEDGYFVNKCKHVNCDYVQKVRPVLDSFNNKLADKKYIETQIKLDSSINHPNHYGGENNPYEAIKVIEAWDLGFSLGNSIKYISRCGKKINESTIKDLKKAQWYIEREIARLEKQ